MKGVGVLNEVDRNQCLDLWPRNQYLWCANLFGGTLLFLWRFKSVWCGCLLYALRNCQCEFTIPFFSIIQGHNTECHNRANLLNLDGSERCLKKRWLYIAISGGKTFSDTLVQRKWPIISPVYAELSSQQSWRETKIRECFSANMTHSMISAITKPYSCRVILSKSCPAFQTGISRNSVSGISDYGN